MDVFHTVARNLPRRVSAENGLCLRLRHTGSVIRNHENNVPRFAPRLDADIADAARRVFRKAVHDRILDKRLQEEPFTDAKVRKALSLAIDRDYVANTIMQGTYEPAYNFVGPGIVDENGMFYDNANGGERYISDDYDANLEEAKQLMSRSP